MAKTMSESGGAKALILQTAAQLFIERGIHAASLGDIAAAAKISKGTLYYYYPVKDELVFDIAQHHAEQVTDIFFAWIGEIDRKTKIQDALQTLLNDLLDDTFMCRMHMVLRMDAMLPDSKLGEFIRSKYDEWRVMLEMGALRAQGREAMRLGENSRLFFMLWDGLMLSELTGAANEARADVVSVLC